MTVGTQSVTIIGNATGPRGPAGPQAPAPTVADVETFRKSSFGDTSAIFVSGYYGFGTPGGGLFLYDLAAGADNGGTVLHDSGGRPFVRQNYTGSIYEWGAKCDGVMSTAPGAITIGSSTFTSPIALTQADIGKPIAIVGAGASDGTLATTILNVDVTGLILTLSTPAVSTVPTYLARAAGAIVTPGSAYVVGDQSVMSDGTTIFVASVGSSGEITKFLVMAQGANIATLPGTLTQSSTTGAGHDFTCTLSYTASGQFAYATNDGAILNTALAWTAANPNAPDVSIPRKVLATTTPILMPSGEVHLRGGGGLSLNSNAGAGILALAPMSTGVVYRSSTAGTGGGGVHSLWVDAYQLAPSATEHAGGRDFIWESVSSRNGLVQNHYAHGSTTDACAGVLYTRPDARVITQTFARIDKAALYGFNFQSNGGPGTINSPASSNSLTSAIEDATSGLHISSGNIFGAWPYAPQYGINVTGQATLIGNQTGGPRIAGVRVAAGRVLCQNTYVQFGATTYAGPGTYGVLIEATGSPYFTNDCVVMGTTTDSDIGAGNVIHQNGSPGTGTVVQNNANATYSWPPASNASTASIWAQPTTNGLASEAATLLSPAMGFTQFNLYDTLFRAIGPSILAKLDLLYVFVALDEITALINIANPSGPVCLKVGAPIFTALGGYTGNGSGYLDNQIITSTLTKFVLNDASMFVWTGDDQAANNSYAVGQASSPRSRINPRTASLKLLTRSQSATDDSTVGNVANSIGMTGWTRNAAPSYTQYKDAVVVGTPATASTARGNADMTFLSDSLATFSTRNIQAFACGGYLTPTEVTGLFTPMRAYLVSQGQPVT